MHPTLSTPMSGMWHWSPQGDRSRRLDDLESIVRDAHEAGLDYVAFKSHDGANTRYLTDDQLKQAKRACVQRGLRFVLWQYVYAEVPPSAEAESFAATIHKFDPAFAFIDVEVEYEKAPGPVSREYAGAFRRKLPHFPAAIAPFGRADKHPGIEYQAWRDHGFGVAPQAYECDSHELTPALCAKSFAKFWPVKEQWVVLGTHKGHLGIVDGGRLASSLEGLPIVNVSAWYTAEYTKPQLRGIATHPGSTKPGPVAHMPSISVKTAQKQLVACGFKLGVTGTMNAETRQALRFFQMGWCGRLEFKRHHGRLTPHTRVALAYAARKGGSLGRKAPNFRFQEFRLDNRGEPRVRRAVGLAAQAYRDRFGPTTIIRSSSTAEHNAAVGGASDSRHLFPAHWDAVDMAPQSRPVAEVTALAVWTGVGHHAANGLVDHADLRPGDPARPLVFADH